LEGLPYTLYDFEKIGCNKKNVKDYYTKLMKLDFRIQQPLPKIFIRKILGGLDLKERKESVLNLACIRLLDNIRKLGLQQTNPIVECGACIYILTLISQKIICGLIGCSDKTLRKKIYDIKDIINKIEVFGVDNRTPFEEFIKDDEYTPMAINMSNFFKINKLKAKALINFNYEMKLYGKTDRLKAVFNFSS